jgi:lia operon protein LiaG
MKKLNYILLMTVLLCCFYAGSAQDFKVTVENTKDGKIILNDFSGPLPIEGYDGKEIIVTNLNSEFKSAPDRAKGLKPVYAAGTDNTGIGLYMEKDGNRISFRCLLPITHGADYRIKVPNNFAVKVKSECGKGGNITVDDIRNEVEVSACHSIKVRRVTGPLVLSTISGNIDVTFTEVNKDKPISIAAVSGEIDVTLPAKTPVNLEMQTVSGNMYSDFEFPVNDKQMKKIGGSSVDTQLNGGGVDLKINNVSGNIYLRKG